MNLQGTTFSNIFLFVVNGFLFFHIVIIPQVGNDRPKCWFFIIYFGVNGFISFHKFDLVFPLTIVHRFHVKFAARGRFAIAMNTVPGFLGIPVAGHRVWVKIFDIFLDGGFVLLALFGRREGSAW